MRVLLVQPAKSPLSIGGDDVQLFEPLALGYLAAGVAPDHDVRILDLRIDKDLRAAVEEFSPDVVGITAYTVHVNTVRRLFDTIRRWDPGILTVVGGHHATVAPEDFFSPSIDVVVIGEGVESLREIVERREKGRSLRGIPGTAVPDGDGLVKAEPRPFSDLDSLPFPDRIATAKYREKYFSEWLRPLASIRTSKGCPFRCNFCALWKLTGGRYLRRDPARIVEELSGIEEENIFFADDESLVGANRMLRLAELIRDSGLEKKYFLYGRSDTIAKHPDVIQAWKEVGLDRIFVGLEFFRNEDLEYINKRSSIEDNAKAVRVLQDLDIDIYASFIVRPEFSKEDFAAMRRYVRELDLDFASFSVLTPLPGTDFYRSVEHELLTRNYDLYDFLHTLLPTELPLEEFCRESLGLYKKAVSFGKRMGIMRKFPLRRYPWLISMTLRFYKRLERAAGDYEAESSAPARTAGAGWTESL